ncbi:MAG: DUF4962 domain-containing protein [Alistipes sp.]|nr:DUF4962 domain-containing protein [Alistipes sp.]
MKHTITAAALAICTAAAAQQAEIHLTKQALHPRYREWASPDGGVAVHRNPQPLLWPAEEGDAFYRVRISDDASFPAGRTTCTEQEWAVCVPEHLAPGHYYWSVEAYGRDSVLLRTSTCDFTVDSTARDFRTPHVGRFVDMVEHMPHFRLYVRRDAVDAFRRRAKTNPEARSWVRTARRNIDMEPVPVAPTRPRDTTGMTPFEKRRMINFMYHKFGEVVSAPAVDFSIAYLISGEEDFARAAVRHALHVASLPVDSDATSEDFNRSAIMYGLAVAYDTAGELMTPDERAAVLEAVRVRGEYFYRHYVRHFECHSMDNHVWQHTFRNFMFAAIATAGDIPDASKWLAFCYEAWRGRFPILGGDDGGWHDGNSYFEANVVSFVYVPFVLSQLTGSNFFDLAWYERHPQFLAYSFPKDSNVPTFGDDYDKLTTPPAQYIAYADALARELGDGTARWYADRLIAGDSERLGRAKTFRLYRILTDKAADSVEPAAPARNTSVCFPDAGLSLMHTDPADARHDAMIAFMSVPFGATGHAHAAHNGFSIAYGGRTLFGGTGYYSDFNDSHTLMHYRTRGHNTVLADGLAQVIGENGYGWLPRFVDNEAMTYTLGDASHAYDSIRTPFWIDRMRQAGVEYTAENGFGDPGVTRFRRHMVFLKPDIVVIYDELAAREPVQWTWLLHSRVSMDASGENSVTADNGAARCTMNLFTDRKLTADIHDRFFSPAVNWKKRSGPDGKPLEYKPNRHAEFSTEGKSAAQRFVAVFRIAPDGCKPARLSVDRNGTITVGRWRVEAELDAARPARLVIDDRRGSALYYNTDRSTVGGSTVVVHRGRTTEAVDTLPASLR